MVYNSPAPAASQPASPIINGRVIHNPAKENENMIKKQKTNAMSSSAK
jgi:hypothetical protein